MSFSLSIKQPRPLVLRAGPQGTQTSFLGQGEGAGAVAGPGGGRRYSRFGCVHGLGPVSDVLGAVEDSEGQAAQEVPRGEQAGHGPEAETGAAWKRGEGRNAAQRAGRHRWPGGGLMPGRAGLKCLPGTF